MLKKPIVICEGDLKKAEEDLTSQKQDQSVVLPKADETGDPPTFSNVKMSVTPSQGNEKLLQSKPNLATSVP